MQCLNCESFDVHLWTKASDFEYFTTNKEFNYYYCKVCKVLFINPLPENDLKKIYPNNYYSFIDQKSNLVIKIKNCMDNLLFKKLLVKIKSNNISILDIGGGTGCLLDNLKSLDSRIAYTRIVDIDSKSKKIALRNNHKYFCGKIENFNTDKKFDLIIMLNLIEHVKSPTIILKKVKSMLKKNGKILIKTPNYKSLDALIFRKSYWGGLHCPRHWIIFSASSFKNISNLVGLKIHKFKYTQGAPFWSLSILHFLHKKNIININNKVSMMDHKLNPLLMGFFGAFDFIRMIFMKTSQMIIILEKNKY